ncbi:autotransporter outer membrane beta-barrel domain-containing protein [Labrys sp. LIt4]|uniref:autotransporter family protein n=1 Tax=Labrys sp. LIt4 TaxID=2821355 RepID=UPI001AE097B4|nr:autotransporter outer membrane beta-barrel domain-containing protein [Labrys sp. LIt4]
MAPLSITPPAGTAGIRNEGASTGTRSSTVLGNTTITVSGGAPGAEVYGVISRVTTGGGDAAATLDGGTIKATGDYGYGMVAQTNSNGDASATMNAGSISTTGLGGSGVGLFAEAFGSTNTGNATATINGGTITTLGSHAVYALTRGSGEALAEMNGGSVTTVGFSNAGIVAQSLGVGDAIARQTAGTIAVQGTSVGMLALASGNGDAITEQTAGTISATGTGATGIASVADGSGNAISTQGVNGVVNSTGANGVGIATLARGTGTYALTTAGQVTGGSGTGSGLLTSGAAGGTIDILSTARVDGSASGVAVNDGDGAVTLTTNGTVIGDILTHGGADTIQLAGGTVTGNVDGGIDNDTINLVGASVSGTLLGGDGNDTINWTSGTLGVGLNGGNGSDTALVTASGYNGTQKLDGGDDVSTADGYIDALTLRGYALSVPGANLTNWEKLTLDSSTISLSDSTITSSTEDGYGVFLANGTTLTSPSTLTVNADLTIDGSSALLAMNGATITGDLRNAGLVDMRNGSAGSTVTVNGNYVGNGGTVGLDTVLGADGSPTDLLVINGNASGSTTLQIANVGGTGAKTIADGIKVVQVDGTSTSDAFHLGSALSAGAYDYNLYFGGVADPADQDWYLRSVGINAPSQEVTPYAEILGNFAYATLGTLQQRTGNRIWPNGAPAATIWCKDPTQNFQCKPSAEQDAVYADGKPHLVGAGAWGRAGGEYSSYSPRVGSAYTQKLGYLQAGYEGVAYESASGELTVGAYGTVGSSVADIAITPDPVTGARRKGKISTTGYGVGANLTWLGNNGLYADGVGQFTWYQSDLSRKPGGDNSGWSSVLSLEVGKRFEMGSGWAIVPQAQLAWTHVDFDSFNDLNGTKVSLNKGDSLKGRVGARIENLSSWASDSNTFDRLQVYGIANLTYEFLDGTKINVGGTSLSQQGKRLWGEVGLGGTFTRKDKWSVYGEADYAMALSSGGGDNYRVKGVVGVRYNW